MCGSMVDIQSPTAENRRGKKKKINRNRRAKIQWCALFHRETIINYNKSSAVAEMGDRGHNRHEFKSGGLLLYQVASSSIQPFGHNSVGCHSPRRNISTNYYFVVEMPTVTVRSDDARYLLKKFN